jgi:hypothetical protein
MKKASNSSPQALAELQASKVAEWLDKVGYRGDTSALFGFLLDVPSAVHKITSDLLPRLVGLDFNTKSEDCLQILSDLIIELQHLRLHIADSTDTLCDINNTLDELSARS